MVKFPKERRKHTDNVQLFAIFNQLTSFQRGNVIPAPAVICAHLNCKKHQSAIFQLFRLRWFVHLPQNVPVFLSGND